MFSGVRASLAGLMSLVLLSLPAAALEMEGAEIRENLTVAGESLTLNGAGVRSKFFIDLYVAALYLPAKSSDDQAIQAADEAQAIALHVISGRINSDNMTTATREGFERSTDGMVEPIQREIDELLSVFAEEINEGDVFDLIYVPGEGVRVIKNGQLGKTIGDRAFKEALFGIWLSEDPVQGSLKDDLLGD